MDIHSVCPRVKATFVKESRALHGSGGPLKESANLWTSISGLCWFESAGGTEKLFVRNLKELSSHGEKKG